MEILEQIKKSLVRAKCYLQGQRQDDGRYSLQLSSQPTLLSTAFGGLAELLLYHKAMHETVNRVLSCRNASGRFIDPVLKPHEIESDLHPYGYIADQSHYFSVRFLRCVGLECDSVAAPIEFSMHDSVAWIESLNWADAWLESNRVMFALELLWPMHRKNHRDLLDWLVNSWDRQTGFWGTDRGSTMVRGMAGAFHFLGFLVQADCPLPDAETITSSTLSLQHSDGSFAPNGGGNTCLDMDAIDILCLYWPLLHGSLRGPVSQALQQAATACLKLQNPDGGFSESISAKVRTRQIEMGASDTNQLSQTWRGAQNIRYSSWARMEYCATKSDLWSTMSRVASLLRIVQTLDEPNSTEIIPNMPGAGIAQFVQAKKAIQ